MKTLVIGSNGQLGHALTNQTPSAANVTGLDLPDLDITNSVSIVHACREVAPDVIVNAAAYTAVDAAETNAEIAMAVNSYGARNVASAAHEIGARLIHISTDFVFDGTASTPYTAESDTRPLSVYGRSKRDGELAVLETHPNSSVVLRTAWLYSRHGNNFVKTMLRLMAERDELGVVADQFGTPTWAESLAATVWGFAEKSDLSGIFHWTDGGDASWYDFAVRIQEEALSLDLLDRSIPIRAISTNDFPTPATRPRYSVLDCSTTCSALDLRPVNWRINLRQMLEGMSN